MRRESGIVHRAEGSAALRSYFSLSQGLLNHVELLSAWELLSVSPHTRSLPYICVFKEVPVFFASLFPSSRRWLMLPLESTESLFLWGWVCSFPKCCREELRFGDLVERQRVWDKDEEEMLHSSFSVIK